MSSEQIDDVTLMAYVDGELDASHRLAVESAMARDTQVANRVEQFRRGAELARHAFSAELDEPVPGHLVEAVRNAAAAAEKAKLRATSSAPAGGTLSRWLESLWQPLTAFALGAVLFTFVGMQLGDGDRTESAADAGGVLLSAAERDGLQRVLGEVPGGQQTPLDVVARSHITVIGTFRTGDGDLCREFDVNREANAGLIGVACRDTGRWTLTFATLKSAPSGGFTPASSAGVVDAYLGSVKARAMLTAEEEQQALKAPAP